MNLGRIHPLVPAVLAIFTFSCGEPGGGVAPTVTETLPTRGASAVPTNTNVAVIFDGPMNALSASHFTVSDGVNEIAGDITIGADGRAFTFNPLSDFAPNTILEGAILAGVSSTSGEALAADYRWTFTTGASPDAIAPIVAWTSPWFGATGVPINQRVSITFSEPMDPTSLSAGTVTLRQGDVAIDAAVLYSGVSALLAPSEPLQGNTEYTVTVSVGAADLAGISLESAYEWRFTTGDEVDSTPPTVSSSWPLRDMIGVAPNQAVSLVFSEPMAPSSISTQTLTLRQGAASIPATVTYFGLTATLTPWQPLELGTEYTATMSVAAVDLAGNPLESAYEWRFTTGAQADSTPPTVISTWPLRAMTGVAPNQAASITFSEPMAPSSISAATLTIRQGAAPVAATITYVGLTATLTPWQPLAYNTEYTITQSVGAIDLAGNPLESAYEWRFTTGSEPDTTPPTVVSSVPSAGMQGVAPNQAASVTFSEPMDPISITTTTFTLRQGAVPISATVTYIGLSATLTPWVPLAYDTEYTVTLSAGATDLAGNALQSAYEWRFTTGGEPDTTPPTVASTTPANFAGAVAIDVGVVATFSEALTPTTITATTMTVKRGTTPVVGTVTYSGVTATFVPAAPLAYETEYTVTLHPGIRDLSGNALAAAYEWRFTTRVAPDTIAPTVISASPSMGEVGAATNQGVVVMFSEPMAIASVTSTTFAVTKAAVPVPGAVTLDGTGMIATFTPSAVLTRGTTYEVALSTGLTDLEGNPLASSVTWTFATAAGPNPVSLGAAGQYVLLGTGITTTGTSAVTGDLGLVAPGTDAVLVGWGQSAATTFSTSPMVTGRIYVSNYAAPTPANLIIASDDRAAAYTAVAAQGPPTIVTAELGGRTYAPGIYRSGAAAAITTTLTLSGGPNDVWVFQVEGALSMAASQSIVLTGGAKASNVFWQVNGAISVGAMSRFAGIALSSAAITMGAGSFVNGRLLAQAAITIDTCQVMLTP